jgi:DNA-binding transcriptional ArsR family regulator
MLWALKAPIPNCGAKLLLIALAEHASDHNGEDWTCFPSIDRLKEWTSLSDSSVTRHLAWLEEEGWISKERRKVQGRLAGYTCTLHRNHGQGTTRQSEGSAKPSETTRQIEGSSAKTTRQSDENDPSICGVRPVNLMGLIDEPPIEPPIEPGARARAAGPAEGAGEADPPQGLARTLCGVPSELRDLLIGDPRFGEGWVTSWLDPCRFDPEARQLHPRSLLAKGRIGQEISRELKSLKIVLGEPVAVRP